jgi:hypothetical protein
MGRAFKFLNAIVEEVKAVPNVVFCQNPCKEGDLQASIF